MKRKCEYKYKDEDDHGRTKWVRCENKPKFILITKPHGNTLGRYKELCSIHLKEYVESYDLNEDPYEIEEIENEK